MKEKTKKYIAYTLIVFWAALCAVSYFLMLNVRGGDIVFGVAVILFVGVGVVATLLARKVLYPTLLTGLSVFAAFATFFYAELGHWFFKGLILVLPALLILSFGSSALFIIGAGPTMLVLRIRARSKPAEAAEVPCEEQEKPREPMEDPAVEEASEPRSLFASLLPVFAVMLGYLLLNSLLLTKIYPIRLLLPLVSYAVYLFLGRWSKQRSGRSLIPTALFCALLLSYNIIFNVGSFITLIASSGLPADSVAEYLLLFGLRILFAPVIPAAVFWLGGYIDAILKRFRDHEQNDDEGKPKDEEGKPNDDEGEAKKKPWGFYPEKISRIYVIFIVLIILVSTVLLLFNADTAFDGDAGSGYVPPSFLMVLYTVGISFAALVIALVLKVVIPKTKLWALLLCALLLPYVQYGINMSLFSGPLKGTIEDGGMFYFIVNRDFNFDGYNDKLYQKSFEERTVTGAGYSTTRGAFEEVVPRVTGKGKLLGRSSVRWKDYSDPDKGIAFVAGESTVISRVEIEITFKSAAIAQKAKAYLVVDGTRKPVDLKKVGDDDKTFVIVLDENECSRIQKEKKRVNATFEFEFDE